MLHPSLPAKTNRNKNNKQQACNAQQSSYQLYIHVPNIFVAIIYIEIGVRKHHLPAVNYLIEIN